MRSKALLEKDQVVGTGSVCPVVCTPGSGPLRLELFLPSVSAAPQTPPLSIIELDRLTDEELLAASAQGHPGAFPLLQERLRPYVRNMLRKMLHTDEHVDDLMQEVFLRLFRGAARFDPQRPLRKWLVTIMLNEVRRFTSRQKTVVSLSTVLQNSDEGLELSSVLTDSRPTPEAFTDRALLSRRIRQLLDKLPSVQREAMVMRHLQDKSLEEIAVVLNCPLATVSSRLHYAATKLRSWIGAADYVTR